MPSSSAPRPLPRWPPRAARSRPSGWRAPRCAGWSPAAIRTRCNGEWRDSERLKDPLRARAAPCRLPPGDGTAGEWAMSLEYLLDRLAIQDTITRGCTAIDNRRPELFDQVFTQDAVLDYGS